MKKYLNIYKKVSLIHCLIACFSVCMSNHILEIPKDQFR